jgi:DNA polymerase-4
MSELLSIHSFPQAILHIDGDAFFASCEQSRNPAWKGKPVITGLERGIAASMSYEAKARGITRAMKLADIKRICPEAIILPSDYETYALLSRRFFEIVRRFTSDVDEYGIDECFANISGMRRPLHMSYPAIAEKIRETLYKELGFTFSIGLASNKVLAKIGSNWKKPSGLTVISNKEIHTYLQKIPVGKVWGIGPQTSAYLNKSGIITALDFAHKDEAWVKHYVTKPIYEIWQELHGQFVFPLSLEPKTDYASIQKVRTFTPPSNDRTYVFAQLSKNIENACIKARRYNLAAEAVYIFLKTQTFRYFGIELQLSRKTNIPIEIIRAVESVFDKIYTPKQLYRATGVTLLKLGQHVMQLDLFSTLVQVEKYHKVYEAADKVAEYYGKHTMFLGSSFQAHVTPQHKTDRGTPAQRQVKILTGESKRKRLNIPMFVGKIV